MLLWLLALPALATTTPATWTVDPHLQAALEAQIDTLSACSSLAAAVPEEWRIGILILSFDPYGSLTARSLSLHELLQLDPQIRLLEECIQEQASTFDFPPSSRRERAWLVATVRFSDPGAKPSLLYAHLQGDPDVVGVPIGHQTRGGAEIALGDEPTIEGRLKKSQIDAVLKRHRSQILYCYERERAKEPAIGGGQLVIRFVIAPDGAVSRSDVASSTLSSPTIETCVAGRFMRFQFPAPADGAPVTVTYTLTFTPPAP